MSPIERHLEYLRGELRAERISYGELAELQALRGYIPRDDVELLEAAGVTEDEQVTPPLGNYWHQSLAEIQTDLDDLVGDDRCFCDRCGNALEVGQIGLCDDCQQDQV